MSQDFNAAWRRAGRRAGIRRRRRDRPAGRPLAGMGIHRRARLGALQILGLLTILVGMGGCRWLLRRLLLGNKG